MTVSDLIFLTVLVISRKNFSNNTITLLYLLSALLTGYIYARLSRDEYARRRAYNRYTNFMISFDKYSRNYEYYWAQFIDYCANFDHTYQFWVFRT